MSTVKVLARAEAGCRLSAAEALALADLPDPRPLMRVAAALRDEGHGGLVSYSRKVFIPLTQLCRDVCHYCTFAHPPRPGEPAYWDAEQVLDIARAGARAGCHEALFTLGDKPELRYAATRDALARLGHETTLSYLAEMAGLVLRETGLLPHLNPGVMTRADIDRLGVGARGAHTAAHIRVEREINAAHQRLALSRVWHRPVGNLEIRGCRRPCRSAP